MGVVTMTAATIFSGCTPIEEPILRVGVVSDNQAYAFRNDWGMHNMEQALGMLSELDPEVLLLVGDITDSADPAVFDMTMDIAREKFGSKMPQIVACAGNHDYWVDGDIDKRQPEKTYAEFCKGFGIPLDNPCHTVIKGYHFITMSEDNEFLHSSEYSEKIVAALEAEIKKAVSSDPDKPVFVLTHYPPRNTVSGSHGKSGQERLGAMFKKYPQVISLSGHTHYPLEDERSIWQKEYTALSTSTLAYGCMEERPFNSCNGIIPFAREVNQMMYMVLFKDRLVIRRYNVTDKREIKPDKPWVLPLPFDPAKAVYTDARAAARKAPEFPEDAKILFRYDFGFLYLIFDAAQHDDFVHFYRVKITDQADKKVVFDQRYVGDFYRLEHNRDNRMTFRLPTDVLIPGRVYTYEIYPEESFGKEGKPLTVTNLLNPRIRFRKGAKIYPQE